MEKLILNAQAGNSHGVNVGAPTIPLTGRQPLIERKLTDPSSASPKGEHYPIPSFFEYRIKPREYDPL